MAKAGFKSVDEYIRSQPDTVQPVLRRMRKIIRQAIPDGEEVISYQMPAFRLPGGVAIFFAGWKQHVALYPATEGLEQAFAKELARYEVSKGTIRFPLSESLPVHLIGRIAKYRAEKTRERALLKAVKAKARSTKKVAAKKRAPAKKKIVAKAKAPAKKKVASKARATARTK